MCGGVNGLQGVSGGVVGVEVSELDEEGLEDE